LFKPELFFVAEVDGKIVGTFYKIAIGKYKVVSYKTYTFRNEEFP
jgi:hypothetical protein